MTSVFARTSTGFVPVALAGVLVLGACGSDDGTAGDTVPPAADDLLAPMTVRTAGGGGSGGAATAAPESADARVATDMMLPYRITNFVVGEGLPALPTNDVGFVFQVGTAVTDQQVTELATALGVSGEPVRIDEGYGVSWRVGPDDGTAPSLWVYEDAQLSWSYNAAWATSPGYAGCAVAEPAIAVDPEAGGGEDPSAGADVPAETIPECVEPEPPAGVPSAAEAEARARELVAALGLDPAAFTFEPYADEWFASATAVEQLDGAFAGRRLDVGFGGEGVMQYASGQLAQPQRVGPYPLIGLDEAIERLNDPSGFYGGGVAVLDAARTTTVGGAEVAAESVTDAPVDDGDAGIEPGVIEPMPPDTMPVEEVTVTLVDVQADVWWAWDVDGSVFLLPAYRFIGDDGGWYTVPAVSDEYLVQAAPDEVPVPEPAPVDTPPVEPAPETTPPPVTEPALPSLPVDTKPEVRPTESIPPVDDPVGILGVYEGVAFYPACGNETLEYDGVTWYPIARTDFGAIDPAFQDTVLALATVPREASPVTGPRGFARVAPPGPGDDVGTLVVWADGVARWVSDSGTLDVWMVDDEITYTWVC